MLARAGVPLGLAVALLCCGAGSTGAQRALHGDAPARPCATVQMEGTVSRGQAFARRFGPGLELTLEPLLTGWAVRVWPAAGSRPAVDLATLATPPYHSVTPLLLATEFGFRAQDVLGWTPRSFHYLADPAAVPPALAAYRGATATPHPTPAQERAVIAALRPALEGQITLLDGALVPGTADAAPAAAVVATHLASVPHTVVPGQAGPLGRLDSVRFRIILNTARSGATPCRAAGR